MEERARDADKVKAGAHKAQKGKQDCGGRGIYRRDTETERERDGQSETGREIESKKETTDRYLVEF